MILKEPSDTLEQAAAKQLQGSFLGDFWHFFRQTGKWWLLPPLAVILLVGLLVWLSGTAAAPFIYTLF